MRSTIKLPLGWVIIVVVLSIIVVSAFVVFSGRKPDADPDYDIGPLSKATVSQAAGVWFTGRVIGANDGDTIALQWGEDPARKIRLMGIDAPESSQPFGEDARDVLRSLVLEKKVMVFATAKDRYGRYVGWVYPLDMAYEGVKPEWAGSINELMLSGGYAWHYKAYDKSETAAKLQDRAKSLRIGLWGDSEAEAPWEYRRRLKKKEEE